MCSDLETKAGLGVRWIHVGVASLALQAAGCDRDECEAGQVRCRDNVAEVCDMAYSDGSAPMVWIREDCGAGACKMGTDDRPFCALDAETDPRCDDTPNQAVCSDQLQVRCRQGYATEVTDCAGDAGFCVPADAGAMCAMEPEPNELCSGESFTACDGSELIGCMYGYVLHRDDCAARGDACVVTPGYAMCNESAEPDPLCPPDDALTQVCDSNVVVDCTYGYRSFEQPCGDGLVCDDSGGEGFCIEG
jgi:hypothetical protein